MAKKIFKWLGIVIGGIILLIILGILAFAAWNQRGVIAARKSIEGFDEAAQQLADLQVPEEAQIIGLGEATHGTQEFQQLKLDVLKELVEQDRVHSFALEADFGECALINDYVLGKEGVKDSDGNVLIDGTSAAQSLSFSIYHTPQIAALIQWIHDYNATVDESQQIWFYGFDMQNPLESVVRLQNYCAQTGCSDVTFLSQLIEEAQGKSYVEMDASLVAPYQEQLQQVIAQMELQGLATGSWEDRAVLQAAQCLNQYFALCMLEDPYTQSNEARDQYMAVNAQWILAQEQARGNRAILATGHNGHIALKGMSYANMGQLLRESLGSAYYSIGSDFFKGTVNVRTTSGKRTKAHLCSADPLAAQMKRQQSEVCLLDFSTITQETPELYEAVYQASSMGSLGEQYAWYMKLIPYTYRTNWTPVELYDAMLLVYQSTATEVTE